MIWVIDDLFSRVCKKLESLNIMIHYRINACR